MQQPAAGQLVGTAQHTGLNSLQVTLQQSFSEMPGTEPTQQQVAALDQQSEQKMGLLVQQYELVFQQLNNQIQNLMLKNQQLENSALQ